MKKIFAESCDIEGKNNGQNGKELHFKMCKTENDYLKLQYFTIFQHFNQTSENNSSF